MKTKLSPSHLLSFIFCLLSFIFSPSALSQVPQGFNYQAIARDAGGNLITTAFDIKVEIQNLAADTVFWIEEHTVTPNEYGLISFIVGQSGRTGGTALLFEEIDWASRPRYLKTSANTGSGYTEMGITQIMSVPYSLVAKEVTGPVENLNIIGTTDVMDEALFEVRNKDGQVIFAVYNEGVRIYVDDTAKGPKGGFAIGGFGTTKEGESQPYFIVKPDTVRIYINQSGKGPKGGFAIGGYGIDKAEPQNFLFVSDDSVRIYVDNADDDYPKGVKGGFAIGGYGLTKGGQKLMTVSDDSVRIYIDDSGKGPKGGFAIGGFDYTKGEGNNANFFNVSTSAQDTIDPSQNRILWYPVKNAFLTGRVLVELPDSVGENSFASGYESKAIGDYSQALGYQAIARKDYSTAIGYQAVANKINSFAFGQWALAKNEESYAFGRGAIAEGKRSFAFGSAGVDSAGTATGVAYAKGDYSFALGQGTQSLGMGSYAIGLADTARGDLSISLGYKTCASGYGSTTMGFSTIASGNTATAIGYYSKASGSYSMSTGYHSTASGGYSLAMGYHSTASGNNSLAWGPWSKAIGTGSIALGSYAQADGNSSIALGNSTQSGFYGTAIGYQTKAFGSLSTALGVGTFAQSKCEFVVGSYNIWYPYYSETEWDPSDRLFVIGNGESSTAKSNAVTVLKNGNVGIGISYPVSKLDINGRARFYNGGDTPGIYLMNAANTSDRFFIGMYDDNNFGILNWGNAWALIVNNLTNNVGIGTTSPLNRLSVAGLRSNTINSANAIAHIGGGDVFTYFGALDGSPSWNTWIQPLRSTDNVPFGLSLCPIGGNVGIGTTNSPYVFYVYGAPAGHIATIRNDGNTTSNHGLAIACGPYTSGATAVNAISFYDGDFTGVGSIQIKNSTTLYNTTSDISLKTAIVPTLIDGITIVKNMPVVDFEFRAVPGKTLTGFIAQDIEKVYPDAVSEGQDGILQLSLPSLVPILTKAIQEQQQQIESQEQRIESQQQQIEELKVMVEKLMVK